MSDATLIEQRTELPPDEQRGTIAMWLLIVTEAALFAVLFFAYLGLNGGHLRWPLVPLPKLAPAFVMLAVLLGSSLVLLLAERAAKSGAMGVARGATVLTAALGVVFLVLQGREYHERLKIVTPTTSAYGSIFYTITSLHGLHLFVGTLMLLYVATLPELEEASVPPHRALHNVALYWHFVDTVWLFIVGLLYVAPHFAS